MAKSVPIEASKNEVAPCTWEIQVRVPSARIVEEHDHAYRRASQGMKVPGFRPGKVPASVMRQMLGDSVQQHAREHLFEHVVSDALRSVGLHREVLRVIDLKADELEVDEERDLEFDFKVETLPQVEIPSWDEIEVEPQDVSARDEQVDAALEQLGENHPRFETAPDAQVDDEHFAAADLTFVRDGAEGPGAEDIKLGLDSPLYGADPEAYEKALRGAAAGDEVEIPVEFMEGFSESDWVGEKGVARVRVKEVVSRRPATPAELAEELDLDGEDALRERLRERIRMENEQAERERTAYEILEEICRLRPFTLPDRMIEEEAEATLERHVQRMQQAGASEEEARKAADEHREEVRGDAEKRLKHWFAVRKIAQQEKVRVSNQDLDAAYRSIAARQGVEPKQVREHYKENDLVDGLRGQILESKVRAHVVGILEKRRRERAAAPLDS